MKRTGRVAAALAASALLLGTAAQAASYRYFRDVPDDAPYAYEINALKEAGIFTGDISGDFLPNNVMTRAEAAALLVRLFVYEGEERPEAGAFADVSASHWAYGYIETAVKHGMISGYGDGNFGPDDELTYDQAVTLLVRALGLGDMALELGGWPGGYIILGDELGMTRDTVNLAGNPAPRDTVAKLIYNAWYDESDYGDDEEHYEPGFNDSGEYDFDDSFYE